MTFRARFWAAISALHYYGSLLDDLRADALGHRRHTDPPCRRCEVSAWNEAGRFAALRRMVRS